MEKLNLKTINKYQSFQTVEELDETVHRFLSRHEAKLSSGTRAVLQCIVEHSRKVIGVSFASNDYIAEQAKVNVRTVIRAVKILQQRGIIKKIPTVRANGKRATNILVIQPFQSSEKEMINKEEDWEQF